MRLMFITNIFPSPWLPTKGTFNLQLARELARQHEVRVVAPVSWTDECVSWRHSLAPLCSDRQAIEDGIEVYYPRYYYPPKILRSRYGWFFWRSVAGTVRRLLASYAPDAIIGYWAHPDGEAAVRAARIAAVPVVIIVGGSDILLLTKEPRRRRCILDVLREADAVVTVGQDVKAKLTGFGIDPDKIHVVYRGIDVELFCPGDRDEARTRLGIPVKGRMLLWVGRMVPVKGLDILLEACTALRARGAEFRLYLVGDGPLRKGLESDARARGLSGVVSFVGTRPHEVLPDWYRAADLTVLPSRSEGVPNVLLESMACGTPFVASRVGGIPEIAAEPSNRLVPPQDPAALAEALERPLPVFGPGTFQVLRSAEAAEGLLRVVRPLLGTNQGEKERAILQTNRTPPFAGRQWSLRQVVRWALSALMPRRFFLVRGPRRSESVCLTFDDGPHPEHTPRLLDVLQKERVRATFFVVGQMVERHPDLVRRMAADGHLVGHHTYSHSEPTRTSARELLDEVRRTGALLTDLTGKPPAYFRPPHGKVTPAKLWTLWKARQTVVLWNVDPKDWACQSCSQVSQWFERRPLRGGDVVLLHDNHAHAAAVLPGLIAEARGKGLSFGLVSQWTS